MQIVLAEMQQGAGYFAWKDTFMTIKSGHDIHYDTSGFFHFRVKQPAAQDKNGEIV